MTGSVGGFELLGDDEQETRILIHEQSGFAVSIPGHPRARPPTTDSPTYDVLVALTDVPLELGFRAERDPGEMPPDARVTTHALGYASERTGGAPSVAPVTALLARGAQAAATTIYTAGDGIMEHLVVTTACAADGTVWCLYQTARFRAGELSPVEWANLRTAIMSSQSWLTGDPPKTSVWPRSELVEPSARMLFTPLACREAEAKARDMGPLTNDETQVLAQRLLAFPNTDDPPGLPIGRTTLELAKLQIASCAPEQASKVLLRNLEQVKTAHDFRAWCWQCIWAIGNRADRSPHQRSS